MIVEAAEHVGGCWTHQPQTSKNGNITAVFTVIGTFAATTVVCVDKITFQITQNTNNTTS
jgi:hypothetical protein